VEEKLEKKLQHKKEEIPNFFNNCWMQGVKVVVEQPVAFLFQFVIDISHIFPNTLHFIDLSEHI